MVDIVDLLTEHGVPACPIYTVRDVIEDPHIAGTRGMVVEAEQPSIGGVRLLGCPVKMSETCPGPKGPAPALGENTDDVLLEFLGLSSEDLKELRTNGVL